MNTILRSSLLCLVVSTGLGAAELPKKAPLTKYAGLWTSSPFTTKPVPPPNAPEENPFEDLALKGIAPIAGGYLITIMNKKDPTDISSIDTDRPAASEYKFVKVERNPDVALGTVVTLSKGSVTGTVGYDEKLSTPKPPAKKPQQRPPGQPQIPGQPPQPVQPNVPGAGDRQPRARVVPPPTTGAQPGAQPGVQPGARPSTQPNTFGTRPGTPPGMSRGGSSSTHQRPSRR